MSDSLREKFNQRDDTFEYHTEELFEMTKPTLTTIVKFLESNGRNVAELVWQDVSYQTYEDGSESVSFLGTFEDTQDVVHVTLPYNIVVEQNEEKVFEFLKEHQITENHLGSDNWLAELAQRLMDEQPLTPSASMHDFDMDQLSDEQINSLKLFSKITK